jgi:biopolymer transport protein TolQ
MDHIFVHLITLSPPNEDLSMMSLLLKAGIVVKIVLTILSIMSIACWWIIVSKYLHLKKAQQQTHEFLDLFWGSQKIQDVYDQCDLFLVSPVAQCFRKAYVELARIKEVKEKKNNRS